MLRLIRRHPGKLFALTAATLLGVACSDNTTTENSRPEAASSSKVYDANWFAATAKPKFTLRGRRYPVPHRQDDSVLELELHRSDQRGHLSLHHGRHQPVHHQRQHHQYLPSSSRSASSLPTAR